MVEIDNWITQRSEKLCKKLELEREAGQRLNIIIVAEGAIDRQGKPITADKVKKVEMSKGFWVIDKLLLMLNL